MLIKDKILLYEKLEKYLNCTGIETFKDEKKQFQKEKIGSPLTAENKQSTKSSDK